MHQALHVLWQLCCPEAPLKGFKLPNEYEDFSLVPIACCLNTSSDLPHGRVQPCTSCGIDRLLAKATGSCSMCLDDEVLKSEQMTWLLRQPTLEGKNHDQVKQRLRNHVGTAKELLDSIRHDYKDFLLHRWNVRFIRRQFNLDCEHFDEDTEV